MNISRKIILPALAIIFILWFELNAQADINQKVRPQKSVNQANCLKASNSYG